MKCACIIMFVSVCKRANQFFFNLISSPPPPHILLRALVLSSFHIVFLLLSFLEQLLVHYSSSRSLIWLGASCDHQFVNVTLALVFSNPEISHLLALSQVQGSLPWLSNTALTLWEVEKWS